MVRMVALILTLAVAGGAAAQTTTCRPVGDGTTCTTDPQVAPYQAPQPYRFESPMDAQARGLAVTQQLQRQQLERQVADAIRNHRCSDAKDLALRSGDLAMADQVQRTCQ